jgi:hypothetical protein
VILLCPLPSREEAREMAGRTYFGEEIALHGIAPIGRAQLPGELLASGGTVKLDGTSFCLRLTPVAGGLAVELLAGEVCS